MFHSWDDDVTRDAVKDALREGDASRALEIMNRAEERKWEEMREYDSRPPITDPGLLPPLVNGKPKEKVMGLGNGFGYTSPMPVEEWMKHPAVAPFIEDILTHVENDLFPSATFHLTMKSELARHIAISFRQWIACNPNNEHIPA